MTERRASTEDYLDCISVANMRESDRLTIERFCSGRTLMYRAALGVFRAADWAGRTVIAVGGGNNGGDGYALACILARHGRPCRLVKLSEKLTEESAYYAKLAARLSAVEEMNASGARVISVDINSGMNGDTGEAETAVRSDLTVTVGFVKRGLVTENAGRYMKRLVAADIGIVLARQEDKICTSEETEPPSGTLVCPPWLQREPIDIRDASEQELTQA